MSSQVTIEGPIIVGLLIIIVILIYVIMVDNATNKFHIQTIERQSNTIKLLEDHSDMQHKKILAYVDYIEVLHKTYHPNEENVPDSTDTSIPSGSGVRLNLGFDVQQL